MLNEFLLPKIEEHDMDIWFQQDGATCHTVNVTIDLLRTVFEIKVAINGIEAQTIDNVLRNWID